MSRSWSSAHDWKSCRGQKLLESSNLSISAKRKSHPNGVVFSFAYCLLRDSNVYSNTPGACSFVSAHTGEYLYFVFPSPARENKMQANLSISAKKKGTVSKRILMKRRRGRSPDRPAESRAMLHKLRADEGIGPYGVSLYAGTVNGSQFPVLYLTASRSRPGGGGGCWR